MSHMRGVLSDLDGPSHEKMVYSEYKNSEDPDQRVHPCRRKVSFAYCQYNIQYQMILCADTCSDCANA